jgi:hypothetical protein
MKFSPVVAVTVVLGLSKAWDIQFYNKNLNTGTVHHKVLADGTERGHCNNIRSDYHYVTTELYFDGGTNFYPDAHSYTAYADADCKGKSYTGVNGWQWPDRTFRSYKVK